MGLVDRARRAVDWSTGRVKLAQKGIPQPMAQPFKPFSGLGLMGYPWAFNIPLMGI